MKVSVIIPTYNREKYICQAIESVLHQTMNNIEVIVVDDGSTDNTREKIMHYHKKIRYIYTKNGGPAHARNIGMKTSKGEYISFLDSDDLYYPYKTEMQASFLDRFTDITLVCTEFTAFDDSGFQDEYHLMKFHKAYERSNLTYKDIFPEDISLEDAGFNCNNLLHRRIYMGNIFEKYLQNLIVCTPTIMFRREILEKVGIQNERYRLFEEYEFILRICKYYKVAFIDVPTYKYRYHSNQISNTSKEDGIQIVIKKQSNMLEIAETHGLNDRDFYSHNKELVNKRLAVLHKALAIPLMCTGEEPKDARNHLKKSAYYGQPEHLLWILTFFPYIVRRIVLKVLSILKIR